MIQKQTETAMYAVAFAAIVQVLQLPVDQINVYGQVVGYNMFHLTHPKNNRQAPLNHQQQLNGLQK